MIRFETQLLKPDAAPKTASWSFVAIPKAASLKLPTRSMCSVEGFLNGVSFLATLEPDGKGSHWLKVERKLREAAGATVGDTITIEMSPVKQEPEPKVPADLRRALAAAPKAIAVWDDITAIARRDWIQWLDSSKKAETREKRIHSACDMLAKGKRRVCCFDRSGMYSKGLKAPKAASDD